METLIGLLAQSAPHTRGVERHGTDAIALLPFAFMCCMGVVGLALFVFWLWALIDCVRREFKGDNDKVIWVLIIVLLNWLGALIYLIIGRGQGTLPDRDPPR